MRSHRKKEGAAWGIALIAVIVGTTVGVGSSVAGDSPSVGVGNIAAGFGIVIAGLVVASMVYYR